MKKILLILFTFSSFSYGHSASKGDFLGTWRLVEYAVDGIFQDVPSPTPIKMYMNGEFVIIFYLENKMHFNKGKYALDAGKATETILESSTKTLIGEEISFKPPKNHILLWGAPLIVLIIIFIFIRNKIRFFKIV